MLRGLALTVRFVGAFDRGGVVDNDWIDCRSTIVEDAGPFNPELFDLGGRFGGAMLKDGKEAGGFWGRGVDVDVLVGFGQCLDEAERGEEAEDGDEDGDVAI